MSSSQNHSWECLANVSCGRNGTCARKDDFLIGYIYLRLFLGSNRRPNKTTDAHRILSQIFTTHIFSCIIVYPIWTHILLKAGHGLSIMVDLSDAAGSRQWQGFDTCPLLRAQAVAQGSSKDTGWLINMPILGS